MTDPVLLVLRNPEAAEDSEKVVSELPKYRDSIDYLAEFIELRASMGDMGFEDVLVEIAENIARVMNGNLTPPDPDKLN